MIEGLGPWNIRVVYNMFYLRHCPPLFSTSPQYRQQSRRTRPPHFVMIQTFPADIIRNRCFICEDDGSRPCSPAPSIPNLDVQFSDAETIVVKEFLEDVGLASVELPKYMIPHQFTSEYDLRGYASLDVFEDLRVQATYFPFMPVNYIHWLDYAIPLSRFFFVDEKWISWGDVQHWEKEDQKRYEEWNAGKRSPSVGTESLDAQANCSYAPPSPFKRPSRVPLGLFSIPSIEDTRRRRTIYYARPPLIRADADAPRVDEEFGRTKWPSICSLSSTSEMSQPTREGSDNANGVRRILRIPIPIKFEDVQERLRRVFYAAG